MTQEELKDYLKENLKISIEIGKTSYRDTIEVSLHLESDFISSSEILIDEIFDTINRDTN